MASKALIFHFYTDKKTEMDSVTAVCRICGQLIRGIQGVTSNFVTHLKRRHPTEFEEYDSERKVDGNTTVSRIRRTNNSVSVPPASFDDPNTKFYPDHPKQKAISTAIINHVIQDLRPLWTLESKAFHELLSTFEPRYEILTSEEFCNSWLPNTIIRIEDAIRLALNQTECVSVTIEIFISDNCKPLLYIAAHHPTSDWKINLHLLTCRVMEEVITVESLLKHFEEVLDKFKIKEKLSSVIVSSFLSAKRIFSLPQLISLNYNCAENVVKASKDAASIHKMLDTVQWPKKIICFSQVLQTLIRSTLEETPAIGNVLSKVLSAIHLLQKMVLSSETAQNLCTKLKVNEIKDEWNAQLKLLKQFSMLSFEGLDEVSHKLNNYDWTILREMLSILEPFEEAIDNMESDSHVPISLILPTLVGLNFVLQQESLIYLTSMNILLRKMLEEKFGYLHNDPLFITAAVVDPRFKISWCSEDKILFIKNSVQHFAAVCNFLPQEIKPNSTDANKVMSLSSSSPPKKKRLFSFIKDTPIPFKPSSLDQEIEFYLKEPRLEMETSPLQYWASKIQDLPILCKLARRLLSIPAAMTPIQRTFSNANSMILPDNMRLLPKFLQDLLLIKFNHI